MTKLKYFFLCKAVINFIYFLLKQHPNSSDKILVINEKSKVKIQLQDFINFRRKNII